MSPATERAVLAAEVREAMFEAGIALGTRHGWDDDDDYRTGEKIEKFLEELRRKGLGIRRVSS